MDGSERAGGGRRSSLRSPPPRKCRSASSVTSTIRPRTTAAPRATSRPRTTNAFSAPRLELFLTSTQGKLAFLAETMFEVGDANEFGIDMERIEIGYLFSDKFRLRVGRFHTAIGYYNDAYHHGRYFQMTVDRPTMVRFEDEGGLIPAHSVGLHGDGRLPARWRRQPALRCRGHQRPGLDARHGRQPRRPQQRQDVQSPPAVRADGDRRPGRRRQRDLRRHLGVGGRVGGAAASCRFES